MILRSPSTARVILSAWLCTGLGCSDRAVLDDSGGGDTTTSSTTTMGSTGGDLLDGSDDKRDIQLPPDLGNRETDGAPFPAIDGVYLLAVDTTIAPGLPLQFLAELETDLDATIIYGATNPITGSDMIADLTLEGFVVSSDAWCGGVTGMVLSPIQVPLEGSTFAAVRLADRDERPRNVSLGCGDVMGE